ncbi:oxalate decarboxylase [Silvibacterium bohemicum]|uniref:Oxalate decarboxylase n=1 Tax=Silvibacterium bohemicum TaxID=1577686 RepID=A0A841JRP3_9BACT|nr:cupin domain-containing protein [Silvibacterium bohemicum]MBB6142449.1 oxalate decarboxylase [Silvibacterium bohemicum]
MKSEHEGVNRRSFLGAAAAALSASALFAPAAFAQSREEIRKGTDNHSADNPGPVNKELQAENGDSNVPPDTDHGDVSPFWYSFDLAHRRIQDGGWTRQVTQKDLPNSKDIAGVTMRLTAGSYRELHWHTANEWAYMLYGSARISVLNPDGTIFIDDVNAGDLWFFPAGYPHSIQGLGPDGCEFLLVFDQGTFSEYQTFLISDWVAHTPPDLLEKNFGLPASAIQKLPTREEYIFPGTVPGPLEDDRRAVGGKTVESKISYSFRMRSMKPTFEDAGGSARIVDSRVFLASKTIAAALVILKPGAIREMHWHPNASEWQYWLQGTGRMTVFASAGEARTMSFHANDVGYVPAVAGHYIENTGTDDVIFLEMFKSDQFSDVSLNQWIRRLPEQIAEAHLHLSSSELQQIPDAKDPVLPQ